MTVELSEIPRVRHYRLAEADLVQLGVTVSTSALDQHVVCQLTDLTYIQADAMEDVYEYQPYATALAEAIGAVRMRVDGTGPWTLTSCTCCTLRDCDILCHCGRDCEGCPSAGEHVVKFRPMSVRDYHVVAPYHVVDNYAAAELLTGAPIGEMPWSLYRTVNAAIFRSRLDPSWPRHPRGGDR